RQWQCLGHPTSLCVRFRGRQLSMIRPPREPSRSAWLQGRGLSHGRAWVAAWSLKRRGWEPAVGLGEWTHRSSLPLHSCDPALLSCHLALLCLHPTTRSCHPERSEGSLSSLGLLLVTLLFSSFPFIHGYLLH